MHTESFVIGRVGESETANDKREARDSYPRVSFFTSDFSFLKHDTTEQAKLNPGYWSQLIIRECSR